MLALPLITPRPDATLWPSQRLANNSLDNSSIESQTSNPTNGHHRRPGSHHGHYHGASRSALAALATDENVIYQRKQNVRRFGAGWIRPPGVAKTYQAIMDEAAEREEQEALARREQVLLDLQAAQTEVANREAREETREHEMEAERDLDEDVPEAEADESDLSASEDGSLAREGEPSITEANGDITFNEDSFIEGSTVASEVEHMLEREEAEIAGVLQDERDLDDDVPEAGSYEHTDTELDESSDEVDTSQISGPSTRPPRRSSGRRSTTRGRLGRRSSGMSSIHRPRDSINPDSNRGSIHLQDPRSSFGFDGSSSILDGASFLRSSPAATRESLRSRFMGARAQRDS